MTVSIVKKAQGTKVVLGKVPPFPKPVSFKEIEEAVFKIEGVRVLFRIAEGTFTLAKPDGYAFKKKLSNHWTFDYLYDRIWRTLGKPALSPEMVVIDGHGTSHQLRHNLNAKQNHEIGTIRNSYNKANT